MHKVTHVILTNVISPLLYPKFSRYFLVMFGFCIPMDVLILQPITTVWFGSMLAMNLSRTS